METNGIIQNTDIAIGPDEKKYWNEKLKGDYSKCSFPFASNDLNGLNKTHEYSFKIANKLYDRIIQITKSNDYAIHAFLIGLVHTLLHKYTKETDIVVGTPVYKQQSDAINPTGFLVIKNSFSENLNFKEILLNTKNDIQNSIRNKGLIQQVVDDLSDIYQKDKLFNISVSLTNIQAIECINKIRHDFKFIFTRENGFITCTLYHSSFLYFENFVLTIVSNLLTLLESAIDNLNAPITGLNILPQEERNKIINDFNQTQVLNNKGRTVIDFFHDQVKKNPDKIAVCFPTDLSNIIKTHQTEKFEKIEDLIVIEKMTYKQINEKANQIAQFLTEQKIGANDIIGLLFDPSIEMLISIIGVLKSGAAFLPINTELPEDRIKMIVNDSHAPIILSLARYNKLMNRLLWQCKNVTAYVCLDTSDIKNEDEVEKSDYMNKEIWDRTGNTATDDITGGGWLSSFTGELFSAKEMDEYGENIERKLKPLISNQSRILEIGCSSGISLFKLAPSVKYYYGIDLSDTIINYTRKRVEEQGLQNVKLSCLTAHELDKLNEDKFDVIILNSVIQSFHGHNYLRKVLVKALKKLNDQGIIFVGDVMDYDLKDEMINDLRKFKEENTGNNYKTKTDFSIELFVNKIYFEDLLLTMPEIKNVDFSNKIHTIENELTKYRFDVLLRVDKLSTTKPKSLKQHKHQYDLTEINKYDTNNKNVTSSPDDLVYVIYTSGTSGNPKGVMIKNENLVNYNYWFCEKASINYEDKTILTSSYAFDLGYTSLFTSFLNGCELHIVNKNFYLSPEKLINYISSNHITYLKVTPSFLSILINHSDVPLSQCKNLRLILIGGENINIRDVEKLKTLMPELQIINHYGPTETTIGCITHFINDIEKYKLYTVIGNPISNSSAYILDNDLNILPIGVPGELFIGGNGVGKGYLNNPALTSEKFLLNPYIKDEIFYRTGDLAKWLPDGTIQFLGRADDQVKVKGYRIELSEIENKLLKHPAIKDSIVLCKKNKNGDNYLCAYLVSKKRNDATLNNVQLKSAQTVETIKSLTSDNFWEKFKAQIKKYGKKNLIITNDETITYNELDIVSENLALKLKSIYDDKYKLSKNERIRYKRQMLLDGWGQASQEKLKATKVFVAGAGGGASPTIMQLALAGVGQIVVCDFDTVELSNLNRQFLHDESRIGLNKAESAKMTINKINPNVEIITIDKKLTPENIEEFIGDCDLIFDMFDEQIDKFLISQYAFKKGIPHIIAAMIDINSYVAILHSPFTPCFHCLFDKNKLTSLTGGMRNHVKDYKKKPLAVVASSLFTSTGFAVNEAIKICLGFKEPAYNKFFYFNQRAASTLVNKFSYQSMTFALSDHFKELCKSQGFDWEIGWRGNYLEEFNISRDPKCPVCSDLKTDFDLGLKPKSVKTYIVKPANGQEQERKTIALWIDNPIKQAISIIAINKLGFAYLKLNKDLETKILESLIDNNEVRIIIADSRNYDLAQKLIELVNKNIKILLIDELNDQTEQPSDLSYPKDYVTFVNYEIDKENKIEYSYETNQQLISSLINPFQHNETHEALHDVNQFDKYQNLINLYKTVFISEGKSYSFTNSHDITSSESIRNYLKKELPDYMIPSFFIPIENIPITSNGKLNYKELPEPEETIQSRVISRPKNRMEKLLTEVWSEVLGIKEIGINENFLSIGGDSIKIIQILSKLNQKGYKLNIQDFFDSPKISELALKIKLKENDVIQQQISGEVKLTPIQKWFFSNEYLFKNHFNQAVMLFSNNRFSIDAIKQVFTKIQEHHDMLRATYMNGENIIQSISVDKKLSLEIIDIKDDANEDNTLKIKVNEIQQSINIESGPLLKLALFNMSKGDHLLIVIHHLVVDGISWRIIFEDISTLFRQYEEGKSLQLPSKTGSFQEWADKLHEYAISDELLNEIPYWRVVNDHHIPLIPVDNKNEHGILQDIKKENFQLSKEQTQTLLKRQNTGISNTEVNDLLLAALSLTMKNEFNLENIVVALEGHGRENLIEDLDITRTIGWFTALYPQMLKSNSSLNLKEYLTNIKQQLRKTPKKGSGYGILKYLTPEYMVDKSLFNITSNISFNYLGQFDTDITRLQYSIDNKSIGSTVNTEGKQDFDISVSVIIYKEQLQITFHYNSKRFNEITIKNLINEYKNNLIAFLNISGKESDHETHICNCAYDEIKKYISKIGHHSEIQDIYELTHNQKAFLYQSIKENAQRVQCIYQIKGDIDPTLFNETINEVVNRYDVLRTIFYYNDISNPQQIVLKNKIFDIHYQDISNNALEDREKTFTKFIHEDWEKGFDISREVMRVSLFKIEPNQFKMIWSINRIIADGWCIGLLFNDFIKIYLSKRFSTPLYLKQARPYKDYVKFINNLDKKSMADYWSSYLKNISEKTCLPYSKKSKSGFVLGEHYIDLNRETSKKIKEIGINNNITLNHIIVSIIGTIIARIINKNDIILGQTVSGRDIDLENINDMVGLFINTIPVRITLKNDSNFIDIATELQKKATESVKYNHFSMDEIEKLCHIKGGITDINIMFQNYQFTQESKISGSQLKSFEFIREKFHEQTNYNMNIFIFPNDQIKLLLNYNANIYTNETINLLDTEIKKIIDQILN
jgi:amino acid adenylation domain-containing protein/non-ribosomal peptide synthase protein (TIGR01720 family)